MFFPRPQSQTIDIANFNQIGYIGSRVKKEQSDRYFRFSNISTEIQVSV